MSHFTLLCFALQAPDPILFIFQLFSSSSSLLLTFFPGTTGLENPISKPSTYGSAPSYSLKILILKLIQIWVIM